MESLESRPSLVAFAAALLVTHLASATSVSGQAWSSSATQVVVSSERLLAAMQKCVGYDLTATANNARFQAEVLLELIREGERLDPARGPLLIGHREWFQAFLARNGLTPDRAPLAARISEELGQDMLVDYRRQDVVEAVLAGPNPLRVANVWIFWPEGTDRRDEYSYDDLQSHPELRVTQERVINYRLIDYGDRLWYADIHGLTGRPLTGTLGVLFAVIGEASIVESRSTLAADGTLVVEGRAHKWGFDRTEMMTVLPSGRTSAGVPDGRPDLQALAARLEEPLAIRFVPLPKEPPVTGDPPEAGRATPS